MASKVNERALRNEADWLPQTLSDVVCVRRSLLDAGTRREMADPIVTWLILKASGEPDITSATTRSRYRKVLAGLESPLRSAQRSDSSNDVAKAA